MEGLSKAAGLDRGSVKSIKYERSRNPRIDTIEKLANALGCYPCELLPTTWQTPKENINDSVFEEIMLQTLPIYDKYLKEDSPIAHIRYSAVVALLYNRYLREGKVPKDINIVHLFRNN